MENREIAGVLEELANLIALAGDGSDFYRERAYRTAAEAVRNWPEPLSVLAAERRLTEVQGVGPGIAARVEELLRTGQIAEHQRMRADFPPSLSEVLQLEGIGVKTARRLHDELGIFDLASLEEAALDGRLKTVRGFGGKKAEAVLDAIEAFRHRAPAAVPLPRASLEASRLASRLRALSACESVEIAGEVRRQITLLPGVILVCATQHPDRVLDEACVPGFAVLSRGPARLSLRTITGVVVEVRAVSPASFGAALLHATGSEAHLHQLRGRALARGLRLHEGGLFRLDGRDANPVATDEPDLYRALGLPFIPPEVRDGDGEIEAATRGDLANLVDVSDLLGDLHAHTVASDGSATLLEMAEAARRLGRSYLAITDHTQALTIARGLTAAEVRAQWRELREVEAATGVRLLRGVEADILEAGDIDLGPALLGSLDVVVASLHSHLRMPRAEMTRRLVRAIESDRVDVIGHPSTRKLGGRPEIDVDWDAVFEAAIAHQVALELNCLPDRLDLDGALCRRAQEAGCDLAISTDSHGTAQLAALPFGVGQARRGRVPRSRVITALPVDALLDRFARHHPDRDRPFD